MSVLSVVSQSSSEESIIQETLDLLEWSRLCGHLSTFAVTSQGIRACKHHRIPSEFSVSRRYLSETIELGSLDQTLEGGLSFQGVCDIDNTLNYCLKGGVVSSEELFKVAETLRAARRLRRHIDNPETRPVSTALFMNLSTLPALEKLLFFGIEEGGRIADRASLKLSEFRGSLQFLRLQRKDLLQEISRKNSSVLQDSNIFERKGRLVLAVKAGAADKINGIIHDISSSGGTVFIEPQLVIPVSNKIVEVKAEILDEERRLLLQWSNQVGDEYSNLKRLLQVMLQLELALARARYSYWLNGVPPVLSEETNTSLSVKDFCHPLLLWQERREQGNKVVPISFDVGPELRVIAITGPNTGGKTATLKSIGLAVLMSKIGLFLPCKGSPILPFFTKVFADIGDEQSLQQNLSTFSSHIMRISRILQGLSDCSGQAMVLLDEIGAGTDPTEGAALAIALLKAFADRARLTVATTHLGALKALKYSDLRFENASVAFDVQTISPTYHLQWGIPGRSNALAIARRLGLATSIVNSAEKSIEVTSIEDVNDVIRGLEDQRKRQQAAAEDAASLLAKTELLHEELLSSWTRQREQSLQWKEETREKLAASIHEGQQEVRELIRRLREDGANGEIARKAGQRLRQMENKIQPAASCPTNIGWTPKVGDRIRLLSIGKVGEVVSIAEDGFQLVVRCGAFRSTVDLNNVESVDGHRPAPLDPSFKVKSSVVIKTNSIVRTSHNTVDVRGLRVHEAETVVEEKMRRISGPLWVIHGIGTGKLKRGLRKWLEGLSYVKKVADAESRDGGPGCSVVWLI